MARVFLVNFPTKHHGFGSDLQSALTVLKVESHLVDTFDFLLDIGNGLDIRPSLVTSDGLFPVASDDVFFMKKRAIADVRESKYYSSLFLQFVRLLGAQHLTKAFEMHGKNTEKPASYIALVSHGFSIPRTLLVHGERITHFKSYIESKLAYPFVLKAQGSGGKCVWKIDSFEEIQNVLEPISLKRKEVLVVQEFIPTSEREYRALVFKGRVVAVVTRSSDSFHNNYVRGGRVGEGVITEDDTGAVIEAARIANLEYVGVDFMYSATGKIIFTELQAGPSLNLTKMVKSDVVNALAELIQGSLNNS